MAISEGGDSKDTLAARAVGYQRMIGPALLLNLLLFPIVLFVPLLTTRFYFLSYNDLVLARAAVDLFSTDKFLFVIVFVFGIFIPGLKMLVSALCWYHFTLEVTRRLSQSLVLLSKLSMLDVLLLAVFIVGFKGVGIGAVEIQFGIYLYSLLVLISLGLNIVMASALNGARE